MSRTLQKEHKVNQFLNYSMLGMWDGCLVVPLQKQYWSVDFMCAVEVSVSVIPFYNATVDGYMRPLKKSFMPIFQSVD